MNSVEEDNFERNSEKIIKDLRRQLFESKSETKLWRKRYMTLAKSKSQEMISIESKLFKLQGTMLREKKNIEKKFEENLKIMKDQRNKIDKLSSANKKLLNGLMLLRYEKPLLLDSSEIAVKTANDPLRTSNLSAAKSQPKIATGRKHSIDSNPGHVLIANRARLLAQTIQRRRQEKNRTLSHCGDFLLNDDTRARSTRSHSLTVGLYQSG